MTLEHTAQRSGKLLSFLRRELGLSSSLVSRLKWQNALFVNGLPAHTDHPLSPGDHIRVEMAEDVEGYPAEPLPLSILYEDEYLIALDKPAGVLVHPSPARNSGTLANGLLYYYRSTGQRCAVHPVSRLDRDTFGVVLLAKSSHVHARFCAMQKQGLLEKTYLASVFGRPVADCGFWDFPIGRVGAGSLLRTVDPKGQPSKTRFQVLQRRDRVSLLELHPLTGRTHQLRLHCLHAGCPILGDPQYASEDSKAFSADLGIGPQQLCAKTLGFVHPFTDKPVELHSRQEVRFPE